MYFEFMRLHVWFSAAGLAILRSSQLFSVSPGEGKSLTFLVSEDPHSIQYHAVCTTEKQKILLHIVEVLE
jgi:hypothetical protein